MRAFGPNRSVTGLQITNEVNIDYSKNTSDGYYKRAVDALVRGVITAKRTSLKLGYRHQRIGFNYAFRSSGAVHATDAAFWRAVGRRGGARLRKATDWIGLDIYPGTFTPGILLPVPIADFGDSFLEGVAQLRECYMPKAGFERSTPLRIEETGYPTGPGRTEATQLQSGRASSCERPWPTGAPTGSATSAGSGCATTTARGRPSSPSSGSSTTTTRRSRRSPSTAGSSPGTAAA